MAKKLVVPVCDRCQAPFRSMVSFCGECGAPTQWASHNDRVAWEVGQWRASRAREAPASTQMMLVRTEDGFEPAAVTQAHHYAWDQPLHPEREQNANPHASLVRPTQTATTVAAPPAPAPVAPVVAPPPPAPVPAPPPAAPSVVENGNGHVHDVQAGLITNATPAAPVAPPAPPVQDEPVAVSEDVPHRVYLSKKTIALGLALLIGLPLGSVALGSRTSTPEPRPLALSTLRSGYTQISSDAVRYAVVLRNPNLTREARGISVVVSLFDKAGRLVGTDLERLASLPGGGNGAVAGVTSVAGTVARISVEVRSGALSTAKPVRTFGVRGVQMSRGPGGRLIVRATVSASAALPDARVVVVHMDARGRILGGDFTYLDVPGPPKVATAVVATGGVSAQVTRADVYVVAPR